MRKLVARRAALTAATIASTVLLGAMLGTTPGAAKPPAGPSQLSAEELPPELTTAISRDLKMSPAEYLDRSARAQGLQSYAADFRAEHPDAFAGAWMNREGKPTVAVTSHDAADVASDAGYKTHMAPVSAKTMETSLGQVNQWIANQPLDVSQVINSVAIDVLNSQIVLNVANTPLGHILNLPTFITDLKVQLSPEGGGPVERHPMGGDTYISAPGSLQDDSLSSVDVCSFGFNATDDSGNPLNVSAGHCDPNVENEGDAAGVYLPDVRDIPSSPELGTFAKSKLGGDAGLDYSVIELNERAVKAGMNRPSVRGANGTTLNITGTGQPVVGAPICKSGQSSTFTCGFVMADQVETQLYTAEGTPKTVRGFASSACTLGGDSGGAIVSGTLALGVTSGSNAADAPNCGEANIALAQYGGTATLGVPIRDILSDIEASSNGGVGSGIRVRTRPNVG